MNQANNSSENAHAFVFTSEPLFAKMVTQKIDQTFNHQVHVKDDFEKLLHSITETDNAVKVEFLVLDLDSLAEFQFSRLYRLLSAKQIPCLIASSDHSILHKLTYEIDDKFVSFLPKSILNTMFKETLMLLLEKCTPNAKLQKRIKDFSLTKKPKSLYLLSALLFLEPVFKVLYLKALTGFTWDTVFRTVFSIEGIWPNVEFWLLFPVAGYALFAIRSWSFPFFIMLQAYSLYSYFTYEEFTWPYVAETPHLSTTVLLAFNMALIIYFLTPENRRPFWNKTQRIWRDSSRYATNIKTSIQKGQKTYNTTITNISKTGAYFTSKEEHKVGERMKINIQIGDREMDIDARVRRMQPTAHNEYHGYGVEFTSVDKDDKEFIKDYVSGLVHRLQ